MVVAFTKWPTDLASKYRSEGYWEDLPLTSIIAHHATNDSVAVVDGEKSYTYRDIDTKSNNLANSLKAKGYGQGDTAVVQLGNVAELYIVFFALLKIGVVPVNALFSHNRTELNSYVEQIQPRLLIADRQHALFQDDAFAEKLQQISPKLETFVYRSQESHQANSLALSDLLNQSSVVGSEKFEPSPTAPGEVAFFNLSGGSTSIPKLIPRTHNDYLYSVKRSVEVCGFDKSTCLLVAIPAAHNFAMSSPGSLGTFVAGGKLVMAPDPSVSSCFPLIERHQVNTAELVPPAASLWLQEVKERGSDSLRSLKLLQVGGARLSPLLAAQLSQMICPLQQVFGMAEGLVNYTRLNDDDEHVYNTQGKPMSPADEVWVAGPNGEHLGYGEVGLLMTRGPYTFRGYYNSPEHNAKSFDSDGFYCSGDLIAMQEDGYITVHGREKDQINRGGEKVATEEIENLMLRHPDVIEAGLVAIEDDLLGEKSCAFIMVRKPVKGSQLRRFLRDFGIAEYKLPDRITIVDSLPLTAVGKVDKKELRKQLASS